MRDQSVIRHRPDKSVDEIQQPKPWAFSTRGTAVRLFLTCWMIYSLHAATNTVREMYVALSIGDHLSFRVDEYAALHPDIFEKKGFGWHINANPGASMLGAIPYFLSRPVIDRIVAGVNRARVAENLIEAPNYSSPWPMAREFYREAWRRGFDIKFGLAAIVIQWFCMAPLSAFGVVAMFYLLRLLFESDRTALWLSLLYAFGTPVFFRAGLLNHNMILGHLAFIGFLVLWNPGPGRRYRTELRLFLCGLCAGATVLLDYTGVVVIAILFCYALSKAWGTKSLGNLLRTAWYFGIGSLGPILLLWFYQWQSFGNPFLPPQRWMAPVKWIEVGYQGVTWPQWDLLLLQLFDYRYGLFASCPLLLLALVFPYWSKRTGTPLSVRERAVLIIFPLFFLLFCSCISYARLQFNTGFRYLAPLLPFLFIPTTLVLAEMPRRLVLFISIFSVAQAWSMAMYRDVERGFGVLDSVLHVFIGGFQLPAMSVLSRMNGQYGDYAANGISPLPVFVFVGAILAVVWMRRNSSIAAGLSISDDRV